jgi:hypothetical protein
VKIGGVYYQAWVVEGSVEIDTCILRTIRGPHGYLVAQNEFTWVKSGFGKRATWNWAKRVDPLYRTRFRIETGVPVEFARSKTQALRVKIRKMERAAKDYPETDPEIIAEDARDLAALERRLKHEIRKAAA